MERDTTSAAPRGAARILTGLLLATLVQTALAAAGGVGHSHDAADHRRAGAELLEGRDLFAERCASCHGPRGKGTASAPVDFSHPQALIRLTPEAIARALEDRHGGRLEAELSEDEAGQVAGYLRNYLMLPAPDSDTDIGRSIYARSCSVCHGDNGDAASWAKNSLDPPPADFTAHSLSQLSREEMIDALTFGKDKSAMMPFVTQLSREEIAATVDYIRNAFMSETPAKGRAPDGHDHDHHDAPEHEPGADGYPDGLVGDPGWGKAFFNANCAECHGKAGDGNGPRAYFMIYKPKDFTTADARAEFSRAKLFSAISHGEAGTTMPAWQTVLRPQEIANVAEYVYRTFLRPDEFEAAPQQLEWRKKSALEAPVRNASADPGENPRECNKTNAAAVERGREVYNFRCYFCHGYNGDAATEAAAVLDPPPRNFLRPSKLDLSRITQTLRHGKAGTAMKPFADVLSPAEIADVSTFVYQEFIACGAQNTTYHTEANGWPEHRSRYGAAYPFVTREIAFDVDPGRLDPNQRAGQILFAENCTTCHEGRSMGDTRRAAKEAEEHGEYDVLGPHDFAPRIADLSPTEVRGKDLWARACQSCHAADGTGKNWAGRFLRPHPPDMTAETFWAGLGSRSFSEALLDPRPGTTMPSFAAVLTSEDAAAIADYARRAFRGVAPDGS